MTAFRCTSADAISEALLRCDHIEREPRRQQCQAWFRGPGTTQWIRSEAAAMVGWTSTRRIRITNAGNRRQDQIRDWCPHHSEAM